MLRDHFSLARKPVVGIFEASISLSLSMLPVSVPSDSIDLPPTANPQDPTRKFTGTKFGIVTTGAAWVPVLTAGVNEYLGLSASETSQSTKFKGVESTGLSAEELHSTPAEEVRKRMIGATRRLLADGDVVVVVLGCAGMAGMDEWVEEACREELGSQAASLVRVVDGVKAAVSLVLEETRQAWQLSTQLELTNTYISFAT
jgi:Asp/Glu/hydantoin racemase